MACASFWNQRATRILAWLFLALAVLTIVVNYLIPLFHSQRLSVWVRKSQGDLVAKANGEEIRSKAAGERLRSILWRRGESWNALSTPERNSRRDEAVDSLINDCLITQLTGWRAENPVPLRRETEEEFQQFLKQFPPPDEWRERMTLQGLDEPALRRKISGEAERLDAIENWLRQQPGQVTEADARAWFETHGKEFIIPERVRASHIFLTSHDVNKPDREPEIRELHRRLTAGEAEFAELAATNSDDDSAKLRAGDLGWFSRHRVPPEFADRVFALPAGRVSAPFASHLGWHILLVKEKHPPRAAMFEEMKDEIIALLESRWREAAIRRLVEDLRAKARIEKFPDRIAAVSPE